MPRRRAKDEKAAPAKAKTKAKSGRATPKQVGRYTPPVPKDTKFSPPWVPALMFTFLLLGMAIIISNYLSLLPGDTKNAYLFVGLGLITAGFITATQYR
jgi:cell division protein CrgA